MDPDNTDYNPSEFFPGLRPNVLPRQKESKYQFKPTSVRRYSVRNSSAVFRPGSLTTLLYNLYFL